MCKQMSGLSVFLVMPLSWLVESICVDESVWRFRWQEMGWRLLSLSWMLERPEGVWVGSWSEQKVGLGVGCWQDLRTGPAVGENCSHVYVPMWEAAERPEDEGDSSWTGCTLGWASMLISHRKEQDGVLWECFVFCPCWSVWPARCTLISCMFGWLWGILAQPHHRQDPGKWFFCLSWATWFGNPRIKPPEQSHCEVIFFSVPFKGIDRSLGFRTPVRIFKKKIGNIKIA